jgi:hypothetical protein
MIIDFTTNILLSFLPIIKFDGTDILILKLIIGIFPCWKAPEWAAIL